MHHLIKTIVKTSAVLAIWAAHPIQAHACACCADPGARYELEDTLSDWIFDDIQRLKSDGFVTLHLPVCEEDCVAGIGELGDWDQSTFSMGREGFTLSIADGHSNNPDIVFEAPAPTHYKWLATDPAPGDRGMQPGGLYSEATIQLSLRGSGPSWTGGTQEFPARLILIGQSNACMALGDSTHWMLDAQTENINFRLYGRFAPAR